MAFIFNNIFPLKSRLKTISGEKSSTKVPTSWFLQLQKGWYPHSRLRMYESETFAQIYQEDSRKRRQYESLQKRWKRNDLERSFWKVLKSDNLSLTSITAPHWTSKDMLHWKLPLQHCKTISSVLVWSWSSGSIWCSVTFGITFARIVGQR